MNNKKSNHFALFFFILAGIFVLLNVLSVKGFLRLDLTRDNKYTLARASADTVQNLKDTLTVSAYFSEGLPPPYAQHARYVNDLLEEYLAASNGKFAFEFIDPQALESTEEKKEKQNIQRDIFGRLSREATSIEKELGELGVEPVEIRVLSEDQQQTKRAYMGIVIRYQDKHRVIPVVQNLADLEKTMTGLMRKLVREKEPVLGILRAAQGPSIEKISQALKENVEIKDYVDVSNNLEIPENVDALLVFGSGEHFGVNGAKKIHKFIASGKSAALLVDRFSIDPRSFQAKPYGPQSKTHTMLDLLRGYGLEVGDNMVADATCASINMPQQRGGFNFSIPVKYPFAPELKNLSFDSVITKGLSQVYMPFVSSITITPVDGLKVQDIASSSKVSWLEKEPIDISPQRDWSDMEIKPDGPHILMIEAQGKVPNVFNEESFDSKETRLVVIGGSAPLWDDFLGPANLALALNMVDWLVADTALLEMRSRNFADLPLDKDLTDVTRNMVKYFNILGVPLLLVLYGLIRWRMRESRRLLLQSTMRKKSGGEV